MHRLDGQGLTTNPSCRARNTVLGLFLDIVYPIGDLNNSFDFKSHFKNHKIPSIRAGLHAEGYFRSEGVRGVLRPFGYRPEAFVEMMHCEDGEKRFGELAWEYSMGPEPVMGNFRMIKEMYERADGPN